MLSRSHKIAISILLGILVLAFFSKRPQPIVLASPISTDQVKNGLNSYDFDDSQLSKIVTQDLQGAKGDYAVVIEGLNPNSKLKFYLNENVSMQAASLYKLILIATAYDQIQQGKLSKDTQVTASEKHLIDVLGSKEFGYEDLEGDKITYSVSDLIQRISGVSDNYAAIMLAEKVGWDNVRSQAQKIGMVHTSISSPISTTASDIDLYFKKLYSGQIVSPSSSAEIVDYLSKDLINNRIPANLPDDLKIAHKTGELSLVRNDAGIVYFEGNPYVIVMMSQNLQYEDDGVDIEAKISGDVYNYFTSVR